METLPTSSFSFFSFYNQCKGPSSAKKTAVRDLYYSPFDATALESVKGTSCYTSCYSSLAPAKEAGVFGLQGQGQGIYYSFQEVREKGSVKRSKESQVGGEKKPHLCSFIVRWDS